MENIKSPKLSSSFNFLGTKTRDEWINYFKNIIVPVGYVISESDTEKCYIGDGINTYKDLPELEIIDAEKVVEVYDSEYNVLGFRYYDEDDNFIEQKLFISLRIGEKIFYNDPKLGFVEEIINY